LQEKPTLRSTLSIENEGKEAYKYLAILHGSLLQLCLISPLFSLLLGQMGYF